MKTKQINFVQEFTDCPGGRLKIHGEHSGEQFREDILKPALRENDQVILNLNGAVGFPSSFIDEAFGVLVEDLGFEPVRQKLQIQLNDDPFALQEIAACMAAHAA